MPHGAIIFSLVQYKCVSHAHFPSLETGENALGYYAKEKVSHAISLCFPHDQFGHNHVQHQGTWKIVLQRHSYVTWFITRRTLCWERKRQERTTVVMRPVRDIQIRRIFSLAKRKTKLFYLDYTVALQLLR